MEVILLEKVENLGGIGERVKVRSGYARNFLLPKGKAAMATQENIERIEKMRTDRPIWANSVSHFHILHTTFKGCKAIMEFGEHAGVKYSIGF